MNASNTLHVVNATPSGLPIAPRTPEETGLSFSFLLELITKTLFIHGQSRLSELVTHTKLRPGVLNPILDFMRTQNFCEVPMRGETEGATVYALTELGMARAGDFMRRSQYVGVAPVSLTAYVAQIESQSVAQMGVVREHLQKAFSGIVLKTALLDQFGAAMNSGRAIFVYGPPGSGKTFIAERLVRLLNGAVAIPHAIMVNSEVIQLFDPMVHEAIVPERQTVILDSGQIDDNRWILCKRPVVMCGAELTLEMVDLEFDSNVRFYHAPQQLKANNGLFIVDDLGRQQITPQQLMDRWIVPLDRRIDFLTLHTGQKFTVPFDVIVVFSSNKKPSHLADDAFLRRLGYKILVDHLDTDDYRAIMQQECSRTGIPFNDEGFSYLLLRHQREGRPLLACLPRDILGQVRDYADYRGTLPEMSPPLLDWAWENYFARE